MRSFLNLLETTTGHEIRLAEFGFFADQPSFVDGGIAFYRGDVCMLFSPDTGMLSPYHGEIPSREHGLVLNFTSEFTDGIAYCELIRNGDVLVRFMGSHGSIGKNPIASDGKTVVFFGYPAMEFGA